MKTIVFYNDKGGVGKTTSALAFAQILHDDYGKKILFLDLDKQANASSVLGYDGSDGLTVSDLLLAPSKDKIIREAIRHSEFGVDYVPSSKTLEAAEVQVKLDSKRPQHNRLMKQVSDVKKEYDYCIADCPLNASVLRMNIFAFANDVMVPIQADSYSIEGLKSVVEDIETASEEYNDDIIFKGCFLTKARPNTNIHKQSLEMLKPFLGDKLFDQYINMSVKVSESTFFCPVTRYKPAKTVSDNYRALVAEYLSR